MMEKFLCVALGNDFFFFFLAMTPIAQGTKVKRDKWGYIKWEEKNFCTTNPIITKMKMKRQPTVRKTIFANYLFDKGLISNKHKKLIQAYSQCARDLNRCLSKDLYRVNKNMKRCYVIYKVRHFEWQFTLIILNLFWRCCCCC